MENQVELGQIIAPIQADLDKFEEEFLDSLQSEVHLINSVIPIFSKSC